MPITWDDVIISQKPQTKRFSDPIVSVYLSRLSFNAAVCSLFDNIYQYEWVNVKQGIENNRIIKLGFELSTKNSPHSLHILQKIFRGKKVEGLNLYSKPLIERYFTEVNDEGSKVRRFAVEKVNANTFAINLHREY